MSFFKTDISEEAVKEGGNGSKFIGSSGVYPVTIKIVSVESGNDKAQYLNFNVDYNGETTTFYNMYLKNKDGSKNYGADIFNKLCIISNLEEVSAPEEEVHKLGKDNKEVTLQVLTDFTDVECQIQVQEEYSKWNGEIQKRLAIRNFFTADGATAEELIAIANGDESVVAGTQLETIKEKYASNVVYRDGLTAEDVEAWKKSSSSKSGGASTPAPTASTKPGGLFKKK